MNRNGMGPENRGPATGRGMGPCSTTLEKAETAVQRGYAKGRRGGSAAGRGFGGRGAGRGCGNGRGFGGQRGFGQGMAFSRIHENREDVSSLNTKIAKLEAEIRSLKEKQS